MKKSLFLSSLLAAAMLTGCSNDEPAATPDAGEVEANYMAVQLVTANGGLDSRATEDADNYENGSAPENTVNAVRFYFFYADGSAANVKKSGDTFVNYLDWSNDASAGTDAPNVEKILATTLVIESPKGDKLPETVMAIVNPYDLPAGEQSLDQLCAIVNDYDKNTAGFVMSSSVYAQGTNKKVTVDVAGHILSEADAATDDPVLIHVERVLAKVSLEISDRLANEKKTLPDGRVIYAAMNGKNGIQHDFKGKPLYVEFLGWNVTATAAKSRLVKEINPAWPAGLFGVAEVWNYASFFRSFWAVNPAGMTYGYYDFEEDPEAANCIRAFSNADGAENYTYLQENASDDFTNGTNPAKPTQVIIAARLVDADGEAVEFAEWGFQKYTLGDLKADFANTAGIYYKETNPGVETVITKISDANITFKTAQAVDGAPVENGRYWVYAQLTDETLTYCDAEGNPMTLAEANSKLKAKGHVKVWEGGRTYFYFPIKHLGSGEGAKGTEGVVRNHVYKASITKLTGLGTPVYDPSEVIIPEKPEQDDTFIAASIRILSWRIVNNDVELDW